MLELQQLAKDWEARVLLRDVNLRVDSGETVAILGPSGSGKSTLLKMVAGLESLDGGRVLFDAQDITALAPERRRFALMFQDFALFPHLDVQDNVAFGLVEQGLRKAAARAQACDMLARFGLQTFARAPVTQLSGGEQQRVALARALITQPRVLLLDEPFSALDAELRLQLQTEFRQRIAEFNMATLLVTHDEAEARAMAQRGYRVLDGTLQLLW
ncbi:ABC transporter ATP-binding protein [Candidatus Aalborgicola defluviihabitans]|uniref:ABC transporter ATP-binding protein n=1 Tax=Candidatus Aalborgicola defluviihabitans TaxID=3386187 RepID=UPI001EB536F2|nr:ABC transporter ATP-binding protein [Burkholderiales bacterium]MBL0244373.1 ABC transporter ATP-binding protein [Rhodoferax sp.]